MPGELISISPDSMPPETGLTSGCDEPAITPGYKGIVRLPKQKPNVGMGEHAIGSGMQLSAEIVEGNRTVMVYLLSPVQRVAGEAGRER